MDNTESLGSSVQKANLMTLLKFLINHGYVTLDEAIATLKVLTTAEHLASNLDPEYMKMIKADGTYKIDSAVSDAFGFIKD